MSPVHVTAEVLASKRIGAFQHVTLVAPGVGERFRPGACVAVSVGTGGYHLARRAFWIHQVRPLGGYAARPDGPRGGRPFALPKEPVPVLLVGEGYAAAPRFALAERLRERDCPVNLVLGAPDEAHLLSALEARRTARAVTIVTGDGSVGARGAVAEVLPVALRRSGAAVVYAAGPAPTLHAAALAAEEHGAWSQVALEQRTPCGTGLCLGCPVPVVGEDGVARTARACTDGPVVRGDRVRWDALAGGAGA